MNIEGVIVDGQKWLDKKYPIEERKNIEELDISSQKHFKGHAYLGGTLDLGDFDNLKKLKCRINYFSNIDFSSLRNPGKLTSIDISDNHIEPQALSCFSRFVNLKYLNIGSKYEERIRRGIFNRFYGSLEPLRNLSKLEELHIEATNISSGLEYLPDNLPAIYCLSFLGNNTLSDKIRRELEPYAGVYADWKNANRALIDMARRGEAPVQTETTITIADLMERPPITAQYFNGIVKDRATIQEERAKDRAMTIFVAILGLIGTVSVALITKLVK
nr:9089_t:CDS:1 [Entrophospora candida]